MNVLKLHECSHDAVATVLRRGGIVVVPTNTVYGIIGRATDADVVRRIFEIKERPTDKPLPVFVSDIAMARECAEVSDRVVPFLERVWMNTTNDFAGKVTVVLKKKEGMLPDVLTAGGETVGMRVPQDRFLRDLLVRCGEPLVQTSANISGEESARSADEVVRMFEGRSLQPDYVIDGGAVSGVASTVVDLTGVSPRILRDGAVPSDVIQRMLHVS